MKKFLIVLFLLIPVFVFAEDNTIKPVNNINDLRVTTSFNFITLNENCKECEKPKDSALKRLVETAYASGFIDGIQMVAVEKTTPNEYLGFYKNMTVAQLVEEIEIFYKENPEKKNMSPALVIMSIGVDNSKK